MNISSRHEALHSITLELFIYFHFYLFIITPDGSQTYSYTYTDSICTKIKEWPKYKTAKPLYTVYCTEL